MRKKLREFISINIDIVQEFRMKGSQLDEINEGRNVKGCVNNAVNVGEI